MRVPRKTKPIRVAGGRNCGLGIGDWGFAAGARRGWTECETKPILGEEASPLMMDYGLLMIWGKAMAVAGGRRSLPPNAPNKANLPFLATSARLGPRLGIADWGFANGRSRQVAGSVRQTKPIGLARGGSRYEIPDTRHAQPCGHHAKQSQFAARGVGQSLGGGDVGEAGKGLSGRGAAGILGRSFLSAECQQ
jgi:hypothetical protein